MRQLRTRGFAGLRKDGQSEQPQQLATPKWDVVNRELRRTPAEVRYPQNLWDGKLLAHHLAHAQAVTLGMRQCQRLFRQLDFRLRRPRPFIARAHPIAQTA
jgi:transposase